MLLRISQYFHNVSPPHGKHIPWRTLVLVKLLDLYSKEKFQKTVFDSCCIFCCASSDLFSWGLTSQKMAVQGTEDVPALFWCPRHWQMGGVQSNSGGLVLVKLGPRGAVARQLAMVDGPKYGGIWAESAVMRCGHGWIVERCWKIGYQSHECHECHEQLDKHLFRPKNMRLPKPGPRTQLTWQLRPGKIPSQSVQLKRQASTGGAWPRLNHVQKKYQQVEKLGEMDQTSSNLNELHHTYEICTWFLLW